MATKTVYCVRHYSSRSSFFEKCPIQLNFIMTVYVGTIPFQLQSIVIDVMEYIYWWLRHPNPGVALSKIAAASNIILAQDRRSRLFKLDR